MLNLEQIQQNTLIGRLKNNWRKRDVFVYQHHSPDLVYSIGFPFNGGNPIICEEPKTDYFRVLSLFPEIAVYD